MWRLGTRGFLIVTAAIAREGWGNAHPRARLSELTWGFPNANVSGSSVFGHARGMPSTRVLVVDDHPFGLATLAGALTGRGLVVSAAGSAPAALASAVDFRPAVAVLDLDLGAGPTGIDVARALRKSLPAIGICILTSYRDPRLAGSGLPQLPTGSVYMCKADVSDVDQLVRTIELLEHAPLAQRTLTAMTTGPTAALTDLQVEVLLAVGAGISTSQIAEQRGVTASAIEQTIARICERLEIPRNSSLNQRVQLVQALNRLRGQVVAG